MSGELRTLVEQATRAPWRAQGFDREREHIEIRCEGDDCANLVATIPVWLDSQEEEQANAALIALAPEAALLLADMGDGLAALRKWVDEYELQKQGPLVAQGQQVDKLLARLQALIPAAAAPVGDEQADRT